MGPLKATGVVNLVPGLPVQWFADVPSIGLLTNRGGFIVPDNPSTSLCSSWTIDVKFSSYSVFADASNISWSPLFRFQNITSSPDAGIYVIKNSTDGICYIKWSPINFLVAITCPSSWAAFFEISLVHTPASPCSQSTLQNGTLQFYYNLQPVGANFSDRLSPLTSLVDLNGQLQFFQDPVASHHDISGGVVSFIRIWNVALTRGQIQNLTDPTVRLLR
jgi:hypothetical protein